MNVLKDATDSAENALRSLDGIAPMLAEEARTLALHSEDDVPLGVTEMSGQLLNRSPAVSPEGTAETWARIGHSQP